MYKLCLISDVEYESLKVTSDFLRRLGQLQPETRNDMYTAANIFDQMINSMWESGTEFSNELVEGVLEWKRGQDGLL